ncbi:MAG: hypothetical protein JWN04_3011 [Myxococcaceae bacterium]|nr:hypothetical protein [Myxococcaceae bacterium]
MSRPHPTDVLAREVGEALELAATRGDADLALATARRYDAAGLSIRVCAREFGAGAPTANGQTAGEYGRPFVAKFAGRCAACDQPSTAGTVIVYRTDDNAVIHLTCKPRPPA